MTALTFEVDLPPHSWSPNAREHWRRRHADGAVYKHAVAILAMQALSIRQLAPYELDPGRISLEFGTRFSRGKDLYAPRDRDNAIAAFKYGMDGLVAGGIFRDDSAEHVDIGPVTFNRRAGPFVRITVEAIG